MPPYIKNTLLNFFSFFLIAFSLYIFVSLVSYDVSDSAGAAATQVVRTVIVAPFNFDNSVESFQANNYASITAGTTAATYTPKRCVAIRAYTSCH